jgi:hypothetical protein
LSFAIFFIAAKNGSAVVSIVPLRILEVSDPYPDPSTGKWTQADQPHSRADAIANRTLKIEVIDTGVTIRLC